MQASLDPKLELRITIMAGHHGVLGGGGRGGRVRCGVWGYAILMARGGPLLAATHLLTKILDLIEILVNITQTRNPLKCKPCLRLG